jgi:hypothetical protein
MMAAGSVSVCRMLRANNLLLPRSPACSMQLAQRGTTTGTLKLLFSQIHLASTVSSSSDASGSYFSFCIMPVLTGAAADSVRIGAITGCPPSFGNAVVKDAPAVLEAPSSLDVLAVTKARLVLRVKMPGLIRVGVVVGLRFRTDDLVEVVVAMFTGWPRIGATGATMMRGERPMVGMAVVFDDVVAARMPAPMTIFLLTSPAS